MLLTKIYFPKGWFGFSKFVWTYLFILFEPYTNNVGLFHSNRIYEAALEYDT